MTNETEKIIDIPKDVYPPVIIQSYEMIYSRGLFYSL